MHSRWNRLRMFRPKGETDLSLYHTVLKQIDALKPTFSSRSDAALKSASAALIRRVREDGDPDRTLVESFALVREVCRRVLHLDAFDTQLMGGIVIHEEKIAEMQTGEGKTLTAVLPAYLNALTGNGVHVLTFNDYLARRDAEWMGPVYRFLGLRVGFIQEGMSLQARKEAYASDITYLTAKEAGFDYLRDSVRMSRDDIVQRAFHYAIVDEADSILIDEARIPLIIAGASDDSADEAGNLAVVAKHLLPGKDFTFDENFRNVSLTDRGLKKAEQILHCDNLYDESNMELLSRLNCAVHAEHMLNREVDYIVRGGIVELVDEFTGRVADKRRWPDGLQAAIEAKEHLAVRTGGRILNSITIQHFIECYPRLGAMTATASPAVSEFRRFYDLDIVRIPPNKPCIRKDRTDTVFRTRKEKIRCLLDTITEIHRAGRPVLVGTRSVGESESVADTLKERGISCEVLNAKRDALEAKIIAQAGMPGAVTISTNMAGRGTDIKPGGETEAFRQQVRDLGGLVVLGTNRHESRRIDDQLRGRAGRQGDPGMSRFIISLEDDLFIKYGLKKLLLSHRSVREGFDIDHPVIGKEIDRIQRIIEGQHLEIKKTLYSYSSIIEKQRKIISRERRDILSDHSDREFFASRCPDQFRALMRAVDEGQVLRACRMVSLACIDASWSGYLAEMTDIREGIHLSRLGGKDPVYAFNKLAVERFDAARQQAEDQKINGFNRLAVRQGSIDLETSGLTVPAATWTYLINDNPFENELGLQLMGNMGLSIGAGIYGPLIALFYIFKKWLNPRSAGRKGTIG